jgi:hypothetical protein
VRCYAAVSFRQFPVFDAGKSALFLSNMEQTNKVGLPIIYQDDALVEYEFLSHPQERSLLSITRESEVEIVAPW